MGDDMEKAVEMLMAMLGNNNSEEPDNEVTEETEELNDFVGEVVPAEQPEEIRLDNLFGGKDKRVTLLSSIKPYMNEKRKEKIDMAISIVKLISVSSSLGLNLFDIGR